MITKEALQAAHTRGVQKVLARYGLDKTAAPARGMLDSLGRAATVGWKSGVRSFQNSGSLGTGLSAGLKRFTNAGGMNAAAKTLGTGAVLGAGAYGAGKMFGAGQQSVKQSSLMGTFHAMRHAWNNPQGQLNSTGVPSEEELAALLPHLSAEDVASYRAAMAKQNAPKNESTDISAE